MFAKLVLFDIDGTLLYSQGAGRRAIHAAMAVEIRPEAFESVRFDGKTDPQIVRELLTAADRDVLRDEEVAEVCDRYLRVLEQELADGSRRPVLHPGVPDLLDRLEQRRDTLVGLLTGNLAHGARLKLQAVGIDPDRFRVGAFGSDHADRACLPPIAAERAREAMGRLPTGDEIVIVGDTPADMTCGRSVTARAIGVTTGRFSAEELRAAGAYRVFPDLADIDAVLDAVYA